MLGGPEFKDVPALMMNIHKVTDLRLSRAGIYHENQTEGPFVATAKCLAPREDPEPRGAAARRRTGEGIEICSQDCAKPAYKRLGLARKEDRGGEQAPPALSFSLK